MVKRLITAIVVMAVALGVMGRAHADAAPPAPAPGDSIQTGYIDTKVQMVSEDVVITVGDDKAYVKANFLLRNQGTVEESYNVRFPVGAGDGYSNVVTVENFAAYVDGQEAVLSTNYGPMPHCTECDQVPWANWPVTFPPGQTISIDVIYQFQPRFHGRWLYVKYDYILETGSGWHDEIGSGKITLRFPYEINKYNVLINSSTIDPLVQPGFYMVEGTDMVWNFNNLEPDFKDNIQVYAMYPALWREIATLQDEVENAPESVNLHLALARAYHRALGTYFLFDCGCLHIAELKEIGDLSVKQYELAMQLAPDDVTLNVEYAKILAYMQYPCPQTCAAIQKAFQMSPEDPELIEIAERYQSNSPTSATPHIATAAQNEVTATIDSSTALTDTPATIPITLMPSETQNETNENLQSPQAVPIIPIIVGVASLAAAVAFGLWWRRRATG